MLASSKGKPFQKRCRFIRLLTFILFSYNVVVLFNGMAEKGVKVFPGLDIKTCYPVGSSF